MSRLPLHTPATAPDAAKPRVEAALKNNGYLPNLIGVLANSPAALEMYQEVGAINARSALSAGEREVVQITAAVDNGCGFCKAGHTALSKKKRLLSDDVVDALRDGAALPEPKLDALARFTRAVMLHKGNVPDAQLAAFKAAGYDDAQALDVVLGVALATLCNYANNLARSDVNPELRPYA